MRNTITAVTTALVALILSTATIVILSIAPADGASHYVPAKPAKVKKDWRPCEYEDSNNCVWDARHMGNGYGKSWKAGKRGKVTYITHRRAAWLLGANHKGL